MTVKIYVTRNVSVFVGIPKELMPKLEKMYFCDMDSNDLSPCDILVMCDKDKIIINFYDEEILCNEREFDFVFVTAIEDIAVNKNNGYIYHGSAVVYNNTYTLAFVGSSGSGKTTLVDNLECYNSKFKRISDDLLFVDGMRLYKNYLPTKTRINDGVNNTMFKSIKPSTTLDFTVNGDVFDLSIVVAVNYGPTGFNSFIQLNTFESIETLVRNSRSAPNNFKLMQSVTRIVRQTPIYSLNYYDNHYAIQCLHNALELRK